MKDIFGSAIALTNGWYDNLHAKTTHGLIRGSTRFQVQSVVDPVFAGHDAGTLLDGRPRNIPIVKTVADALALGNPKPQYCIVGVAVHGGKIPESLRGEIVYAIRNGLSIVCGLHTLLNDDPEFTREAAASGVRLIDVRRPKKPAEMEFWSGAVFDVKAPRVAVLGMDCAIGKRTTAKMLTDTCNANGIKAEMIYTGQTGWMQGYRFGFVFDATLNDFITGELEQAILACQREANPDIMFIEGQSALRNPSGPCGAEFLKAGDAKAVILQHAPARTHYDGLEDFPWGRLPSVQSEIELIGMYGARTLAVTLNEQAWEDARMRAYQADLQQQLGIPVVRPVKEGVESLLPVIRELIKEGK